MRAADAPRQAPILPSGLGCTVYLCNVEVSVHHACSIPTHGNASAAYLAPLTTTGDQTQMARTTSAHCTSYFSVSCAHTCRFVATRTQTCPDLFSATPSRLGDFKQLPPATSKPPFIVERDVCADFEFRVLRQNRRVVTGAGTEDRREELENFHQVRRGGNI